MLRRSKLHRVSFARGSCMIKKWLQPVWANVQHMALATILIVDDQPSNLSVLTYLLRADYQVRAANSGASALRAAASEPKPDLVLLDVMMPGMDGYTVLANLRANPATADIPVIFLTALADDLDEERGLKVGAADYLTKPIKPAVVRARVRTQLDAKQARDWMKDRNASLEAEVTRRMLENDLTQRVSIRALAHLAETRDPETGNHILRTQGYVQQLANRLRRHPRFESTMSERYIDLLARSAPLLISAKSAFPITSCSSPASSRLRNGPSCRPMPGWAATPSSWPSVTLKRPCQFLAVAKEIAHWHHEKWDGTGYSDRIAGNAIPIAARLMALADVFDALISARVYKAPMSFAEAREIIAAGRGKHFDPDVCDAFISGFDEFVAIARQYREET